MGLRIKDALSAFIRSLKSETVKFTENVILIKAHRHQNSQYFCALTEMEDDSDLSSSSSSYSSSGEESVGEEEDEDSEEEAPRGTELRDREKRKRKRKLAGRRRELRSKYESVKDFNPEARSAQTEEIERIRRLELQRSLQAANASSVQRIASVGGNETEPSALLGRGPVFGNLAEDEKRERVVEAIVISSDSEEEEDRDVVRRGGDGGRGGVVESGREVKREEEEEERGGRYDVLGEEVGEQIVVNLGHPPDEEDVLLVPQVVRIIKPHQVGSGQFGHTPLGFIAIRLIHVHIHDTCIHD